MTDQYRELSRREFFGLATAAGVAVSLPAFANSKVEEPSVNDVSKLNPVTVAQQITPRSTEEIQQALSKWQGSISIGGGRFSMGGQIAEPKSLHLDMRAFRQVLSFDPAQKRIRVQAGITWRDIQDVIDPHELSIKIMQSYSNFTVGGSVSVNCHGRYVGHGPLINSVRAVQLITADGSVLELSRDLRPDLFRAVFGGYGGLGVISEVELELADNVRLERVVADVSLQSYAAFFQEQISINPNAVLHNADLTPPDFSKPKLVTWIKTEKPLTEARRLIPRDQDYDLEQNVIWALTELPGGPQLRSKAVEPLSLGKPAVVRRNFEASLDVASLEPRTRLVSTYLLQEYFIPVGNFLRFAEAMAKTLQGHDVNALNVSIRHSPADRLALLSWAPTEVFSFVLYYKRRRYESANITVERWTRQLIDAALDCGGRYYLPYRLDASTSQFWRAYPETESFLAIKKTIDPNNRFRNLLWDKYLQKA